MSNKKKRYSYQKLSINSKKIAQIEVKVKFSIKLFKSYLLTSFSKIFNLVFFIPFIRMILHATCLDNLVIFVREIININRFIVIYESIERRRI